MKTELSGFVTECGSRFDFVRCQRLRTKPTFDMTHTKAIWASKQYQGHIERFHMISIKFTATTYRLRPKMSPPVTHCVPCDNNLSENLGSRAEHTSHMVAWVQEVISPPRASHECAIFDVPPHSLVEVTLESLIVVEFRLDSVLRIAINPSALRMESRPSSGLEGIII